jgi:hypothetical protein
MNALGLSQIAAVVGSLPLHQVESTVAMLLNSSAKSPFIVPSRSTLNNDGAPLQLCVSASTLASSTRFIADPAYSATTHSQQRVCGHNAIARLCSATSAPISETCDQVLQILLPHERDESTPTSGILWTASSAQSKGAAVYVNARWSSEEQNWQQALSAVSSILPQARDAERLSCEMMKCARVASVGIESNIAGDIHIKIYWRFTLPIPFYSLNIQLLQHPGFASFLSRVLSDRQIPLSALVCSAGFSISTGDLEDIKIDICAHCVRLPLQKWLSLSDELIIENSLQPLSISDTLLQGQAEVAFLGLGISRSENRRLNLYLKPCDVLAN